jgi:hypothetical protein
MPVFKNRKKAFARHIKKSKSKITAHRKCKAAAKAKGKAPSKACNSKRSTARKELAKAEALYKTHRASQRKKGKWTAQDAAYFNRNVAATKRLLRVGPTVSTSAAALLRSTGGRSTGGMRRTSQAPPVYRAGMRISKGSAPEYDDVYTELDEAMSDVPYDADSASFESSDDMDVYEDEGILARLTGNPLLAVASVAVIGGLGYVTYTRLK